MPRRTRPLHSGCFGRLLERRLKREQPFKDDKVLSSSNGLMIAALARRAGCCSTGLYDTGRERRRSFILDNLVQGGRLMSSWREGVSAHRATSDDYAYLVWGLFELYQTTHNPEWLQLAVNWTDNMLSLFWDNEDGGLFPFRQRCIRPAAEAEEHA